MPQQAPEQPAQAQPDHQSTRKHGDAAGGQKWWDPDIGSSDGYEVRPCRALPSVRCSLSVRSRHHIMLQVTGMSCGMSLADIHRAKSL